MAISRTYTFTDPTMTLAPVHVDDELSALVDAINNLSLGVSSFTTILIGSGGAIFTTPNGLHTYRLSVDNDGSLVTEQLT